ncbi:hypothetical protein [Galbitalea soli]|uniref:LysM domain-containing protein n=1 Tax=Galbitalea soli TaxID=1268042 RepID=A0A7C9PN63_9MICO|nr:hypothetical protein [Galbitalea soli]NEM91385.1 hypothetical protein [Galbitalea soli]NYJ30076.1 LysM repeat protein [Galbitalea soli]
MNGLPHDYGVVDGARGTVSAEKNGAPYQYKVAAGDRLNEIAHRFGYLNGDAIEKLNVKSTKYGTYIYVGQLLYLQNPK